MQKLNFQQRIHRIARHNSTVLIEGETGSGKSHLAKQIHLFSPRAHAPFIALNLATLNENLFESELFGHDRGAYTGATTSRIGKLELAQGGTIFLDEIGELSLSMQARLLEVLNSKIITPVGSNRKIHLDVRIITATNKNLSNEVRAGKFRQDLLYRINTISIELPRLADRGDSEILFFAEKFLAEIQAREKLSKLVIDDCLKEFFCLYEWPGNLRQLRSTLEYAVVFRDGDVIQRKDLPRDIISPTNCSRTDRFSTNYQHAKASFESEYLNFILAKFNGKINQTAREAQISKVTLIEKIRRHNIDVNHYKFLAYQNSIANN